MASKFIGCTRGQSKSVVDVGIQCEEIFAKIPLANRSPHVAANIHRHVPEYQSNSSSIFCLTRKRKLDETESSSAAKTMRCEISLNETATVDGETLHIDWLGESQSKEEKTPYNARTNSMGIVKFHHPVKRSIIFRSLVLEWLQVINFESISLEMFADINAEYTQKLQNKVAAFKETVSFRIDRKYLLTLNGERKGIAFKMAIADWNEAQAILCPLYIILSKLCKSTVAPKTEFESIFCHFFQFKSKLRNVHLQSNRGDSHYLYFY